MEYLEMAVIITASVDNTRSRELRKMATTGNDQAYNVVVEPWSHCVGHLERFVDNRICNNAGKSGIIL